MFKGIFWLMWSSVIFAGMAGLNVLAFQYFWYWRIWWFDLLMHALGGMAIGGLVIFLILRPGRAITAVSLFRAVLVAVLIFGLLWELLEFSVSSSGQLALVVKTLATFQLGWADTVSDLLAGLFGALVVAGLTSLTIKTNYGTA